MVTSTDNRPLPKSGAESEFDRGVGAKSYASTSYNIKEQGSNGWAYLIVALLIAGGGYYYYMSSYMPSDMTPVITETVTPPVVTEPEATTPTVVAPENMTPPVTTPDPNLVPKTTP